MSSQRSDLAPSRLGRYIIVHPVAEGGMGEVFLAHRLGPGGFKKPVALKLLRDSLTDDATAVRRFLDEAQLASRMDHPNVVAAYDVGKSARRYFLAMELVRGPTLAELVDAIRRAGRSLSVQMITFLARGICDGLHHAHELLGPDGLPLELVHRDVSPQNFLVSKDGEVKLTDFGVATARLFAGCRPGLVHAKVEYAAPEVLSGAPGDRRTDVYGAGMTLYELATLKSPFRRHTPEESLKAVRQGRIRPLAALRPDLPAPLVNAIDRATSTDPRHRFATAQQMRDALPRPMRGEGTDALGAIVRELCQASLAHFDASPTVARAAAVSPERQTLPLVLNRYRAVGA